MALVLKINSTDRSDHIFWPSLRKIEGLTKDPDTLNFQIKQTSSKTIPSMGDEVELLEDTATIFKGLIIGRKEINTGGKLIKWLINCKDWTHILDRELVVKSYESQTAEYIVKDIIDTYTTGFTYTNVSADTPTISSIKFNYEPVSKALQRLADLIGYDWYVDYTKDLHFFDEEAKTAPFEINDDDGKLEWQTLQFDKNILELKNAIFVRGGEYKSAISEANAVDKYEADGTQRSFNLIYRYSDINVKVAGVAKTVGVDFIDDPSSYDCLYNFQEKALKFPEASKPSSGQEVKVWGDAHIPLIAKVRDQISIAAYGEYQHIIVDKNIKSVSEAQTLAKAELVRWAEGSYEAKFKTTETGLQTGQQITVNSAIRGVNRQFKINRIVGRARGPSQMEYTVYLLASGEITFTDIMRELIGKDVKNIDISDDEVLQRLETFMEDLTLGDSLSAATSSPPYTWGVGGANDTEWGFGTWA